MIVRAQCVFEIRHVNNDVAGHGLAWDHGFGREGRRAAYMGSPFLGSPVLGVAILGGLTLDFTPSFLFRSKRKRTHT